MIRYCCDMCKRDLDPDDEIRYVVKIEISAAFDPQVTDDDEDDRDHLEEIQEMLERLAGGDDDRVSEDVYRELRFDLCAECHRRFLKNPLGREAAKALGFSNN